jgi:hypothetical protein
VEKKPSEQRQSKPKPKLVMFHCGYFGRDGHKDEFCFKRKREERMAEWANKDKYHSFAGTQGKGECEDISGLGRAKGCWRCCWPSYTGQIGEGHQSDRCRPGQIVVWVSCSYRCEFWFWRSWFLWLGWRVCRRLVC